MIQSLLHILFVTLATASPVPQYGQSAASNCPNYCAGTAYNASLEQTYICGDYRLGPVTLPSRLPISDLVDDYKRFGDLCPGEFLKKWYYDVAATWVYPPLGGYLLNTDGLPIKGNVSLKVGWLLDRFGSEYGSFVSPEGAPYNQRALPPSNLNTPVDDTRYVRKILDRVQHNNILHLDFHRTIMSTAL